MRRFGVLGDANGVFFNVYLVGFGFSLDLGSFC